MNDVIEDIHCHNNFCCFFKIKLSVIHFELFDHKKSSYTYHLVAYSGKRSYFGIHERRVDICGVIACLNASKLSCGQRFDKYENVVWPIVFDRIAVSSKTSVEKPFAQFYKKKKQVKGRFVEDRHQRQYPNSLLSNIRPIPPKQLKWRKKIIRTGQMAYSNYSIVEREFSTLVPQKELLTFAIYGRNLDQWENNVENRSQINRYVREIESSKTCPPNVGSVLLVVFQCYFLTVNCCFY